MIGYLTHNNVRDYLIVMDGEACRAIYRITSRQDFRNAIKIGHERDLSGWSGDVATDSPERWTQADFGEVIAINRGDDIEIRHPQLFADRQHFWTGDSLLDAWREGRQHIRAELADWLRRDPIHRPYGYESIPDNTFAAVCYDKNTEDDLKLSANIVLTAADEADRRQWGLSEREWAEQVGMAYEAKLWDRAHA
ncbi:MAG: hypothetical protein ACJ8LM_05545 [Candidatus Udaeobacter sp.]